MGRNYIRRLMVCSVLTAAALALHAAEGCIPFFPMLPGVKLGLANIITLVAMVLLSAREAFAILSARILIGGMFGGLTAALYSAFGGLCCFAVMLAARKIDKNQQLWFTSVLGACTHIIAQLLAACVILGTSSVMLYTPLLIISAVVTGWLTGTCADIVIGRIEGISSVLRGAVDDKREKK